MKSDEQLLVDLRKILKCHLDKDRVDWELWWEQVHAMDKKYKKRGPDIYKYMQWSMRNILKVFQSIEGEEDVTGERKEH